MPRKLSPFAKLLAELKQVLDELGLAWYVFGAQAALLYGSARLTADLDVTVHLGALPTEKLAEHLRHAGFSLRINDIAFVRTTRVLPVVHDASGMPVDVVLSGPGLEEQFHQRAILRDFGGVQVPVASAEDIVVMKLLADREKDRGDVTAIIAAQATLDLASIRHTLELLEEALGQSDLTPAFDQALRAARIPR